MRRWMLIVLAVVAAPMGLWLIFATDTYLSGEWESASYAVGWTFNMALLATGGLIALVVPAAIIFAMVRANQRARELKRGWR